VQREREREEKKTWNPTIQLFLKKFREFFLKKFIGIFLKYSHPFGLKVAKVANLIYFWNLNLCCHIWTLIFSLVTIFISSFSLCRQALKTCLHLMAKSLFFLAGLGDATKSENWKNNFTEYKIISFRHFWAQTQLAWQGAESRSN